MSELSWDAQDASRDGNGSPSRAACSELCRSSCSSAGPAEGLQLLQQLPEAFSLFSVHMALLRVSFYNASQSKAHSEPNSGWVL